MGDMIQDAIVNYLVPTLKEYASQEVVYVRGTQSVTVSATFGQKLLKTHDQFGGIRMEWTDLDFIIIASELHFEDGILITPTRGDLVYVTVVSEMQAYEVLPFGNEPCWRWSDPYNLQYRIHTKHVDTEQSFS